MVETFPFADQAAIGMMIMSGVWDVTIDYNGLIFQVALDFTDDELNQRSCMVHFNAQHSRGLEWSKKILPLACKTRGNYFKSKSKLTVYK